MSIFVVTGGAGFIGSHLAVQLAQAGHEVRIFDNLTGTGARERAANLVGLSGVTLFEADIRDLARCREVCSGAEYVFHEAAEPSVVRSIEDPSTCVEINVTGTVNMLRAASEARTVRRFVYASTCAIYGDTPESPKRESMPPDPLSPYASSKLAGELFCRNFYRMHGLPTIALRYFNVYGAGQDPNGAYAAVIPRFLTQFSQRQPLTIFGDGEQTRDFIHVQDVVDANLKATALPRDIGGEVVNIGSGQATSLNDLVEKLERITQVHVAVEKREPRSGDIRHSLADISRAADLLGYTPSITLENGLARTLPSFEPQLAPCN